MGEPETLPDPEDLPAGHEPTPRDPAARPDWLVGAEEGAQSEYHRSPSPPVELKLVRPSLPESPAGSAPAGGPAARTGSDALPGLPLSSRQAAPAAPATPVAWTAAGNSVTRLVEKSKAPAAAELEAEPDDPFGDGRPVERALPGAGDDEAARLAPQPLHEPWWMIAGERLATDRRLQLVLLGVVVVVGAAWMLWPRDVAGVSVREIRRHAEQWEGRTVRVSGRAGEVFSIGQGVVYYLHQGRDTIVVFSRSRTPEPRQKVSVDGTVSTGYLDGAPRVAILENTGP